MFWDRKYCTWEDFTQGIAGAVNARGLPGFPGQKGEPGQAGDKGDRGYVGLPGREIPLQIKTNLLYIIIVHYYYCFCLHLLHLFTWINLFNF